MLTGLSAIEHGVLNIQARLAPEAPTLASKFRAAGYETNALHEGGFVNEIYDFDQSFDDGLTPGDPIHQSTGERISPFPREVEPYDALAESQHGLEALGYLFDREATAAAP